MFRFTAKSLLHLLITDRTDNGNGVVCAIAENGLAPMGAIAVFGTFIPLPSQTEKNEKFSVHGIAIRYCLQ